MKKKLVILGIVILFSLVVAKIVRIQPFIFRNKAFSVMQPLGFTTEQQYDNKIIFRKPKNNAILYIIFSPVAHAESDEALTQKLEDPKFRHGVAQGLIENTPNIPSKVLSSKSRKINNIPAWEFLVEGNTKDGPRLVKWIVLYKNRKEFFIIFTLSEEKIIEKSLETLKIY